MNTDDGDGKGTADGKGLGDGHGFPNVYLNFHIGRLVGDTSGNGDGYGENASSPEHIQVLIP